jgi:hypothetical protein
VLGAVVVAAGALSALFVNDVVLAMAPSARAWRRARRWRLW